MKIRLGALAIFTVSLFGRASADQPTSDFDFGVQLFGPPAGDDQLTTLAVDSVGGNDANAGTLYAPKRTLQQAVTDGTVVGLYRGSTFRDSLPLDANPTVSGVVVQGLSLGSGHPLPIISALDPVPCAVFTNNADGTYSYTWTTPSAAINNGYDNVYIVEINTATEVITPIASRHRMLDVNDRNGAVQTPGSMLISGLSNNQWNATIHPTDGLAPGSGAYRYEVTTRYCPANWVPNNARGGAMGGLMLVGSTYGYGTLAAPTGFTGERLVFVHGTTHNAVIAGGSLQRSVFYEMGDSQSIQLAVYHASGAGLSFDLRKSIFYANTTSARSANCFLAHTDGTYNFDRINIADCAFLGARNADGSFATGSAGLGIGFDNVTAGAIRRVYISQVALPLSVSTSSHMDCQDSVIRDFGSIPMPDVFRGNIVAGYSGTNATVLNGGSYTTLNQSNPAFNDHPSTNDHNIYWMGTRQTSFARIPANSVHGHNIYVTGYPGAPSNPGDGIYYPAFNAADAAGISNDYNLIIQFSGYDFRVATDTATYTSWAAYRAAYPALDAHSRYIDAREAEAGFGGNGIRDVLNDPYNGDFRWSQTPLGYQCAAFCQANNVGPATVITHWPVVPTVDEAVAAITLLPPKVTSPGTVTFTQGVSGAYQITTDLDSTPDAPTSYGVTGQPTWLGVNASSGVLSGIPPQTGSTSVSISATNRAGTTSAVLGITVQTTFMAWQNTHFTAAELNDPAISGPNAAPAGDGIPNLLKYALGLDPKSDGTGGLPAISFTAAGDSKFLTLTYNKLLGVNDATYTVEVSGDLKVWSSGANATATVTATTNPAGTIQTVVERDLAPTGSAGKRFIRLKISQP